MITVIMQLDCSYYQQISLLKCDEGQDIVTASPPPFHISDN